jgi:predicted helicase
MAKLSDTFYEFLLSIQKTLSSGHASEGAHYPTLKSLVENLDKNITVTSLPARIECGAPDFIVSKGSLPIGYIEAKDIDKSLDDAESSEQLKRYRVSLDNLILTDYLEFRWYLHGEKRLTTRLGTLTKDSKIKKDAAGIEAVGDLLTTFLSQKTEAVGSPKELALRMARMAHMVRDLIINAFSKETGQGSLHAQLSAFRESLIPDLPADQFADMYAQTIAYGLFAARCGTSSGKDFTRQNASYLLPKTNPFLRKLFNHIAGPDLDDRITWLVDDLAQLLAQADMAAIVKDFGKRTGREDPVVHFYETFLAAYDPSLRQTRGVYYTPIPVVSYIVRSIDRLLKANFSKPEGLADDGVFMLDPAVGTATFLYTVIGQIYEHLLGKGQRGTWDGYVADSLLPRLFGFELLMAPYAMAHLKLGLQLQETGYSFKQDQRLGIYLTNTLDEAIKHSESLFAQWITEESNAAAEIKKDKPIMVVLGNPPYSGQSANSSFRITINSKTGKQKKELNWIGNLIEGYKQIDGKPLGEKNPKWLQDDYVKFIAFGQWRIGRTGQGVLGFITNHSYLDNPTFRGMRQSLLNTFSDIYILNLHGNAKKKETSPDGSKDENVFDIQQGVAIGLFIKEKEKALPGKVHYADLWGTRAIKYKTLSESDFNSITWQVLNPTSPSYLFVPTEDDLLAEYEAGWKITDIFQVYSVGIVTARDELTIHWTREETEAVVRDFSSLSPEYAREKYRLGDDVRDWKVSLAQKDVKDSGPNSSLIVPILYRPFDVRFTYYTGHSRGFICMPRNEVMRHMVDDKNIGLVWTRPGSPNFEFSIISTRFIADQCAIGNKSAGAGITYEGPLYLHVAKDELQLGGALHPNLNPKFIQEFEGKLGLAFIPDGKGDFVKTFAPEDIFNYTYAVLHTPAFRSRYAGFLKRDFPRLPLTTNKTLFRKLAEKGSKLVPLHLMEATSLSKLITTYPVTGSNLIDKVMYDEKSQRIYINKNQYFEGIQPEIWSFQVGGYQVCHKWLKDRKGRMLTYDDLTHYQKIIVALKETIRLMQEIDSIIPEWPII